MPEAITRTIDHVVHAVADLDAAAEAYAGLGFTITPKADHPFGTSNRLVVLDSGYIEIVSVTDPSRLPDTGFAASVSRRLRFEGEGITHLVLSSQDPPSDLAALGPLATGEIFNFSRPAPQPKGPEIKASFACTLMHGTEDLGMFLCKHLAPEAVWNDDTTWHPNLAHAMTSLTIPVAESTIETIAAAAGVPVADGGLDLGGTIVEPGPPRITFDAKIRPLEICGITVGGTARPVVSHRTRA